jgi:spoIIIJ-associated protein
MAKKTEVDKVAQQITHELLKLAEIDAQVEATADSETIKVNIIGDDLGILIGFHGETLKAIQILLGVLVNREVGEATWYRVLVDVGSWRSSRQTSLEEMAQKAIEKVRDTGGPVHLPPLSPDERRLIHLFLQDQTEVRSFSEGEGSERHIVIALL